MPRQRSAPDMFEDQTGGGRGVLGTLGGLVAAHPSLAGGSVAFAVIFGFVAANALWHQPGKHPAPILNTREAASPAQPLARAEPAGGQGLVEGVPARSVTTYRIERSDGTPTASIPVPDVAPAAPVAVPAATPAAPVATAEPAPTRPAADPVLTQIQTILAERGLYGGEIDGLMGPKSAAAIRAWEKANGYTETGEPTAALLAAMASAVAARPAAAPAAPAAPAAAVAAPAPAPRPAPVLAADARSGEPVTVPAAAPVIDNSGVSELVRQIQSGLSNIAYADIAVDGVAGAQTRAAISAFEKHYRLPVTGEPNEDVLNKLLEIGAL